MQEFSPYQTCQNTLHRWWQVVLCVILGGVLGLILHLFFPTIYEAQSILVASMNFPPTILALYLMKKACEKVFFAIYS